MLMIHNTLGFFLLVFHWSFFFRSLFLIKKGKGPFWMDRTLMLLSQIFLPLTILTGLPLIEKTGIFHVILCFMPVVMMFILSRKSVRRKSPLLLPLLNGIFIAAAFLTGVFI